MKLAPTPFLISLSAALWLAPAAAEAQGSPRIDSPAYQAQDAETKRDQLWSAIELDPYLNFPGGGVSAASRVVWRHLVSPSFEEDTDLRPRRFKIFHTFGTTAKVRFVPTSRGAAGVVAGSSAPGGDFTGIFESGGVGIARFSLGLGAKRGVPWIPGIAVKLFVDGRPSVNIHALPRDGGQSSRDFMRAVHSTKLDPSPVDGLLRFASRGADPSHRRTDNVAAVKADGTPVAQPKSPFKLEFRPLPISYTESPDWGREDYRRSLAKIQPGTSLYAVWAVAEEGSGEPEVKIGELVLESRFVASDLQDRRLHFLHVR